MKNPKNKGSEFERRICRSLTKLVTGEEKPEIFWRSASSGGKATIEKEAGNMSGDIMSVNSAGQFIVDLYSIECKFYKDWRFEEFLTGKGKLNIWWSQACRDAKKAGKNPMLIFKKNRSDIYVMFVCMKGVLMKKEKTKIPFFSFGSYGGHPCLIYRFSDFLKAISIPSLKSLVGKNGSKKNI